MEASRCKCFMVISPGTHTDTCPVLTRLLFFSSFAPLPRVTAESQANCGLRMQEKNHSTRRGAAWFRANTRRKLVLSPYSDSGQEILGSCFHSRSSRQVCGYLRLGDGVQGKGAWK